MKRAIVGAPADVPVIRTMDEAAEALGDPAGWPRGMRAAVEGAITGAADHDARAAADAAENRARIDPAAFAEARDRANAAATARAETDVRLRAWCRGLVTFCRDVGLDADPVAADLMRRIEDLTATGAPS